MPLITTPKQLNQRAELYHQLGIMIAAGLSIQKALEHLAKNPPSHALRAPISQWLDQLNQGHTVTGSLRHVDKWMPSFDVALIDAAERSGRMDACFKLLAEYYRERAEMARRMISDTAYPLFVFNFAIVLFPLVNLIIHGNFMAFLRSTLGIAVPLYGAVFLVIYACQGRHGESWRAQIENVLGRIPILGTGRRNLALARLSMALESLLNAGVPIVTAWELAAKACGSPALDRTVQHWKAPLQEGSTFSELITNSGQFPDLFCNLYHTGEVSGTLDQSLIRLHDLYQSEGFRKLKALAEWTPKLIYFGVLIYGGWMVISSYLNSDEYKTLNEILK